MSFVSPDDDRRPGYVRDSDEAEQERSLRAWALRQYQLVSWRLPPRRHVEDHE